MAAGNRQLLDDINVDMTPSGAITGRIFDRDGDPMGATVVQAYVASYRDGKRVLQIVQSTYSNDLGEYRLFGLRPGRYYLSAAPASATTLRQPFFLNTSFDEFILPAGFVPSVTGQARQQVTARCWR